MQGGRGSTRSLRMGRETSLGEKDRGRIFSGSWQKAKDVWAWKLSRHGEGEAVTTLGLEGRN